jgi:hypothetical protein
MWFNEALEFALAQNSIVKSLPKLKLNKEQQLKL